MGLNDYEQKHLNRLRPGLSGCTVLLKSDGAFPLDHPGSIAAIGSGVRHTLKGGTGSGEVNSRFFITVEQGLQEVGFRLTSGEWLAGYDRARDGARKAFIADIKARAKAQHVKPMMLSMGAVMPEPEYDLPLPEKSDCAIYVLSRICGEGSDRRAVAGDYLLTQSEIRDILKLNQTYEKFMLVLNVGAPVDLSPVMEVRNILLLSQLGVETGRVLASLLLGRDTPSGKLAATWASQSAWCPDQEFGGWDDTRYGEGIYVGYRYYDTVGASVQFPFGHGLSYTSFSVKEDAFYAENTRLTMEVTVCNTGVRPGREVVQLYVSVPEGILDQPYQALAAFKKTSVLEPGSVQKLQLRFDLRDLSGYDEKQQAYILEQGDYILRLGTSSADTKAAAVVRLGETVTVCRVRPILEQNNLRDRSYSCRLIHPLDGNLPICELQADAVKEQPVFYDRPGPSLPEVEQLTDEELAYLNVGGFIPGQKLSIVGNAAQSVCGAAGETTQLLKEKNVPALVMADGPAGLRLSSHFYRDEKGLHGMDANPIVAGMLDFMSLPERIIAKHTLGEKRAPRGVQVEEQYATALPVGTALAQSWDLDFIEVCGDVVGAEMERFGVHLWLAPAMNIQRHPLCGRNYEYYSEDPLLTGLAAAAMTRSVQRHPGCGVTIKHFAANNQETNRCNTNSVLTERTLREIYLRGFAICIRESNPKALMTSYNLLNGVHTSECTALIHGYLRGELGYQGLIMTDWIVDMMAPDNPKYPGAEPVPIAAAGGNLMMPGGPKEHKKVLAALQSGLLSRQTLRRSASQVISAARELTERN